MTENSPPIGQRYSLVYADKGLPGRDSSRARKRIYHLIGSTIEIANTLLQRRPSYGRSAKLSNSQIVSKIQSELGVTVPYNMTYLLEKFLEKCELQDFLDTITISTTYFKANNHIDVSAHFIAEVSRIFGELNLAYRVDPDGGVHPIVDKEFEASRISAISLLSDPRYAGALKAFEESHSALEQTPSNGKNAIRCVFEAVEIVFKLIFPKADRIGEAELRKYLEPALQRMRAADSPALSASIKLSNSLADWVNAAHWYRHGQGAEEPIEPPLALVVTVMSMGASYLRWLVDLDVEIRIMS